MGYNKTNPKLKIIYKLSEHGESASNFWGKCKGKGPTLIIIKSNNNKKFGAFRTLPF
jgi:hypothetical protein